MIKSLNVLITCCEEKDCGYIDKRTLDSTSNRSDYSVMWLASCYYLLKDTIKARNLYTYYSQIPVNRNLTIQSDSLYEIASKLEKENKELKNQTCHSASLKIILVVKSGHFRERPE